MWKISLKTVITETDERYLFRKVKNPFISVPMLKIIVDNDLGKKACFSTSTIRNILHQRDLNVRKASHK